MGEEVLDRSPRSGQRTPCRCSWPSATTAPGVGPNGACKPPGFPARSRCAASSSKPSPPSKQDQAAERAARTGFWCGCSVPDGCCVGWGRSSYPLVSSCGGRILARGTEVASARTSAEASGFSTTWRSRSGGTAQSVHPAVTQAAETTAAQFQGANGLGECARLREPDATHPPLRQELFVLCSTEPSSRSYSSE